MDQSDDNNEPGTPPPPPAQRPQRIRALPASDNGEGSEAFAASMPPVTLPPPSSIPLLDFPKDALQRPSSLWRRVLRTSLVLCLLLGIFSAAVVMAYLRDLGVFSLSEATIRPLLTLAPSDNSVVYDRKGRKIGEFFTHYYKFVAYKDMPPDLIKAVVAVEDRKFWQHKGVDVKAILRAVRSHLKGEPLKQGASTITQQTVRAFLLTPEKTLERKIREAALALFLEKKLAKERILEIYLNNMFLGNGAYGVGAAAERYFGKPLGALKTHELALIAGLFQSPSRYNPHKYPERAKKRQEKVLRDMYAAGNLTREQALRLIATPLVYKGYDTLNLSVAPYFVDYIKGLAESIMEKSTANRGLRIYTTLDSELQAMADASLREANGIFKEVEANLPPNLRRGVTPVSLEAAMLVTEPSSGEILAMIGGRDYSKSQFNRATDALRAPGSAFKPIVYSLALNGKWKWSDMLYVSPINVDGYRPKNFSQSYLTETTLLRSLYKSINTTTLEVGKQLGLRDVFAHAKELGMESPIKEEAGSLLGASEVTLLDMARVYGTYANLGQKVALSAIRTITDRHGKILYQTAPVGKRSQNVLSKDVAYLMVEGLRAVFRHGTAARFWEMADWAAGKTGTTNESRDNWFCGFTSRLTGIVWVGADTYKGYLGKETGSSLALPVWASFMRKAAALYPPTPVSRPDNVVSAKVEPNFGNLDAAGITMYFIKGKEPQRTSSDIKDLSQLQDYRTLFDQ